jgi:hypothetical protein
MLNAALVLALVFGSDLQGVDGDDAEVFAVAVAAARIWVRAWKVLVGLEMASWRMMMVPGTRFFLTSQRIVPASLKVRVPEAFFRGPSLTQDKLKPVGRVRSYVGAEASTSSKGKQIGTDGRSMLRRYKRRRSRVRLGAGAAAPCSYI